MEAPVHYYDTQLHGIPCGAKGAEVRSTKYARNVTCRSCLAALREKPMSEPPRAAPQGSPAA